MLTTRMPGPAFYFGLAQLKDKIIMAGGFDGVSNSKSVYEFDPMSGKWTDTGLTIPTNMWSPLNMILYNI